MSRGGRFPVRLSPRSAAIYAAIRFAFQQIEVWASAAYFGASGGGGRNCNGLVSAQGVKEAPGKSVHIRPCFTSFLTSCVLFCFITNSFEMNRLLLDTMLRGWTALGRQFGRIGWNIRQRRRDGAATWGPNLL